MSNFAFYDILQTLGVSFNCSDLFSNFTRGQQDALRVDAQLCRALTPIEVLAADKLITDV